MSRRNFIRRAGLGASTLAVIGAGALAYRAYDQGVLEAEHGPAYEPWDDWQRDDGPMSLVRAAILAPSPHNAQPWRFGVGNGFLDVHADRTRTTGVLDPFLRELRVGLGAAIENAVLAARAGGTAASVLLMPSGTHSDHVAHLALAAREPADSGLSAQIPHRHTNRYPYIAGKEVPRRALDAMSALADPHVPEARIVWVDTAAARAQLGELIVAATAAIVDDADQRASDARWFRQSWDHIHSSRDGITLDTAGLPDLTAAAAKLLPAQSPQALGESWLDATRSRHTGTAAAYGIVAVRDASDPIQQLQGGRLLQRVHLWATGADIALHHMNQLTERADRERQLGINAEFGDALGLVMPSGWQALSTFRIGYSNHRARRSPRRPTSEVVL
jgi:hypothetical protein